LPQVKEIKSKNIIKKQSKYYPEFRILEFPDFTRLNQIIKGKPLASGGGEVSAHMFNKIKGSQNFIVYGTELSTLVVCLNKIS
jgi:hypothetical protein